MLNLFIRRVPLPTWLGGCRVFSENGCFLLVLFCSTHKSPQFFSCGRSGPGPEPRLDYELLTAAQCVTLYQVGAALQTTLPGVLSLTWGLWAGGGGGGAASAL